MPGPELALQARSLATNLALSWSGIELFLAAAGAARDALSLAGQGAHPPTSERRTLPCSPLTALAPGDQEATPLLCAADSVQTVVE